MSDTETPHPGASSDQVPAVPVEPVSGDPEADAQPYPPPDMPPVPEEIREAGRLAPDHWLGMIDPTWTGEGPPPEWAVVGQWRSGLDGEIVEWRDNEEYKPSPRALGWPEPTDDVDAAVQLAATGYGPGDAVTKALAAAEELAVFLQPDGGPQSAVAPDGTAVVPVFTSPTYLHTAGRLKFELMNVTDLLDRLPEKHFLYLNPSAPVGMTVQPDTLREELGSAADAPHSPSQRPSTVGRAPADAGQPDGGEVSGTTGTEAASTTAGGARGEAL